MKPKDIVDAWAHIRKIDQTIPDDVLDFMKDAALAAMKKPPFTIPDWTTPNNGAIEVPDYLDPLINKVGFQVNLHLVSQVISEPEMVCRIVRAAEVFFHDVTQSPA